MKLIDAMQQIVWSTTVDGRLKFGNTAWSVFVGSRSGADVEEALAEKIHVKDRTRRSERWRHALHSMQPYDVEYRLELSGRAGARWYLERGAPLRGVLGNVPTGWAVTATPIEASKSVEEELRMALGRRNDFFAVVSHELRHPLAPIANALEVLGRGDESTAGAARGIIQRQLRQLTRLIEDLQDVSRLSVGRLRLQTRAVDVQEALDVAIESARPLIALRHHSLTVTKARRPVVLIADPVRIAQVLTNLLTNAAKYTPPGGHVCVEVERDEANVRIRVRDDGIGIPREKLTGIFELFRQGAGSRADGGEGLGVGLAVARELMELHGGWIDAKSAGVGEGAEFTICMPGAPEPGYAPTPHPQG